MMTENPRHRTILAIDMQNSTSQNNVMKIRMRRTMYSVFEGVLESAGITREFRDPLVDRGDGILALIHPADDIPKTLLLSVIAPRLAAALEGQPGLRLRAVVHAGEVHYDEQGCFGESLDLAFRLLDAAEVKAHLEQETSPLALVVSDDIHRSVIRHGYPGIDELAFEPTVHLFVAGFPHCGWIQSQPAGSRHKVLAGQRVKAGSL
jgi:class 3 adenylate cyclase